MVELIDDTKHRRYMWKCMIWGTTALVESTITSGKCKTEVEDWKHGSGCSQQTLNHCVSTRVIPSGPIKTWTTHAASRRREGPTRLNFWGCFLISNLILRNAWTCRRALLLQSHYKASMGPLPRGPVTAEWACINNQDSLWNFRGNSCGVKEANKLPSKYHWFSLRRRTEQLAIEPRIRYDYCGELKLGFICLAHVRL